MIDFQSMRAAVASGLREYIGCPVVRGNQTSEPPQHPYATYMLSTPATENNGTYQQHDDGIDRLMVRSIWSFSFMSADYDESMTLALKARDWFDRAGRVWLQDRGITVQSITAINNRDNILTVEYERKNGFDVVFYVFNEVENIAEAIGYIEDATITHETN